MNRRGILGALFVSPFAAKEGANQIANAMTAPAETAVPVTWAKGFGYAGDAASPVEDLVYKAERIKALRNLLAGKGEEYTQWLDEIKDGQNDITYAHYQSLRSVSEMGRQQMIRRQNARRYMERQRVRWLKQLKELLS